MEGEVPQAPWPREEKLSTALLLGWLTGELSTLAPELAGL